MLKIERTVLSSIGSRTYELEFRSNYEIAFRTLTEELDIMLQPIDDYIRRAAISPYDGLRVYRRVIREVTQWIYETTPPLIRWSAGWDDSRHSLYNRLSKQLEKVGYNTAVGECGNNYYAYRM